MGGAKAQTKLMIIERFYKRQSHTCRRHTCQHFSQSTRIQHPSITLRRKTNQTLPKPSQLTTLRQNHTPIRFQISN